MPLKGYFEDFDIQTIYRACGNDLIGYLSLITYVIE